MAPKNNSRTVLVSNQKHARRKRSIKRKSDVSFINLNAIYLISLINIISLDI